MEPPEIDGVQPVALERLQVPFQRFPREKLRDWLEAELVLRAPGDSVGTAVVTPRSRLAPRFAAEMMWLNLIKKIPNT